ACHWSPQAPPLARGHIVHFCWTHRATRADRHGHARKWMLAVAARYCASADVLTAVSPPHPQLPSQTRPVATPVQSEATWPDACQPSAGTFTTRAPSDRTPASLPLVLPPSLPFVVPESPVESSSATPPSTPENSPMPPAPPPQPGTTWTTALKRIMDDAIHRA